MQGVVFDLSKVTGEDMDAFTQANRVGDVKGQALGLSKVIVSCPAEWGDPSDPQTYLKQPFFSVQKPLISAFFDEANGKN